MVLVLAFRLGGHDEHPAGDRWFSADKAKHFFVSAFIQSASYSLLRTTDLSHRASLAGASALTLAIGVGKELHDRSGRGDPSWKDMTWNVVGMAAASGLLSAAKH